MRQAFLVVVLAAAAFAGGAAVNGPGLSWAKGMIGGRLREPEAIPTLDLADDGARPVVPPQDKDKAKDKDAPASGFPAAPAPTLGANLPKAEPAPARVEVQPSPVAEPPAESKSQAAPPDPDPLASEALSASPTAAAKPESPRDDPAVALASAPPAAASGWGTLRVRMKGLGVSRYWVEGTPGGPCTFRCAIPLAGSASVFQQFEAEGDDDLGAAEAALRRIALWKATETDKD